MVLVVAGAELNLQNKNGESPIWRASYEGHTDIVGNTHIKSVLRGKDGTVFKSFIWNGKNTPLEPFFLDKKKNQLINIAGKMRLNEWKGKRDVEFIIEDISLN